MNSILKIFLVTSILFFSIFIYGCGAIRESAGVNRKAPDEYQVIVSPPLELPPDYNLLPSDEIIAKKRSNTDNNLSKEIIFGLNEEAKSEESTISSSVLDSILKKSGASNASDTIREEIDLDFANLLSYKGAFSGDKYRTEQEILDAVKESERIRNNLFNNKNVLDGDVPFTKRPRKKRDNLFKKLF